MTLLTRILALALLVQGSIATKLTTPSPSINDDASSSPTPVATTDDNHVGPSLDPLGPRNNTVVSERVESFGLLWAVLVPFLVVCVLFVALLYRVRRPASHKKYLPTDDVVDAPPDPSLELTTPPDREFFI
ncbi:Aste57867_8533 [Aphanomyces stellatus]|uniref:Aste57867_8533 protein n=1 Tax=Aphanomyces stellatus TaxID=120398 RepID=A0A485KKM0_9STRA|nr:hypothetical protein As57867_008501 [Aphanomyces stellatus]VFT85419.1 Aste57867_8533 [Aphanomyces stellatus]